LAARIAEALSFIEELPDGWDTDIGEGGHKLSGGQRQRIAIARAVLKDAPVLVLDEATSNVDNETEAALKRSIERISVGRTTLIIAHRLSTVRNADVIAVIGEGVISEMGTHEELLESSGHPQMKAFLDHIEVDSVEVDTLWSISLCLRVCATQKLQNCLYFPTTST
jgi:ATP-binding cassette subfamily B protein